MIHPRAQSSAALALAVCLALGACDEGQATASDAGADGGLDGGDAIPEGGVDGAAEEAGASDSGPTGGDAAQEAGPTEVGETGQLVGITEAHNAVRRALDTDEPLPDLVWSDDLATYAQQWADALALDCSNLRHSFDTLPERWGENIAHFGPPGRSNAQDSVDGWASEVACWTYGTLGDPPEQPGAAQCDLECAEALSANGCDHYTQLVARRAERVGCGWATCDDASGDVWVCNYDPQGKFTHQAPY